MQFHRVIKVLQCRPVRVCFQRLVTIAKASACAKLPLLFFYWGVCIHTYVLQTMHTASPAGAGWAQSSSSAPTLKYQQAVLLPLFLLLRHTGVLLLFCLVFCVCNVRLYICLVTFGFDFSVGFGECETFDFLKGLYGSVNTGEFVFFISTLGLFLVFKRL